MAFKIDNEAAGTEPTRPAAATMGFFSNLLRTTVPDWWLNMIQNEIASAVTKFGLTLDKTNDNQLGLAIEAAVAQSKSDTTYINISSNSTTDITQNSADTYTYPIADFLGGAGLVQADIREVHVECVIASASPNSQVISAKYPDGNVHVITRIHAGAGAGTVTSACVAIVPIKPGQTDFDLIIGAIFTGATYTIVGVTQRVAP